MTIPEIQNEVIRELGAGARTTAPLLLPLIDEGQNRIYNKLVKNKLLQRLFYTNASWNTKNGTNEYTVADGVPTDIKFLLKVETRYDGQAIRHKTTKIEIENIEKMDEITTSHQNKIKPKFYWMGEGVNTIIGFVPTHDVAGDDYTKIWYMKKPVQITDNSQSLIIPSDGHYLVVRFAHAGAQLIEDEDKAGWLQFLAQFNKDCDEWIESCIPATTDPVFTQDVNE